MADMSTCIAFHIDLIQDVSALRPLVRLASSSLAERILLVSPNFRALDRENFWFAQIERLASETGASILSYANEFDVFRALSRRRGICIAGSESDVRAHRGTHDLFRSMPSGFLRVTLQHGFECLGFLHNERHTASFGRNIRFAADIIVGWFDRTRLKDVSEREASKLYVAGPMMMIEDGPLPDVRAFDPYCGIICENTHSVRFSSNRTQQNFLKEVEQLGERLDAVGKRLHFRPHPAGQFLMRTKYELPTGVAVEDAPLFELNLTNYAFAISAPSTILFDFILAGVPTAIWGCGKIDASNFAGLRQIGSSDDCWRFVAESTLVREDLLSRQNAFVADLGIPRDVRDRYAGLLALSGA